MILILTTILMHSLLYMIFIFILITILMHSLLYMILILIFILITILMHSLLYMILPLLINSMSYIIWGDDSAIYEISVTFRSGLTKSKP